jgi:hypothetical protein
MFYKVSCVILSHDSPSVTQVIARARLLTQLIMPQTDRLSVFEVSNISRSTSANDSSRTSILTK